MTCTLKKRIRGTAYLNEIELPLCNKDHGKNLVATHCIQQRQANRNKSFDILLKSC
jgi:hypothetical protein